jgi:spore coat polysaccharide biosynthesis protein SpsF
VILAILQARASSKRLDQKVLKKIMGKPMLVHEIERVQKASRIDKVIVATSLDTSDEPIANLAKDIGVEIFRGSLDDVLDRFYQAAIQHNPEYVVRLTGDCPLIDHKVIDAVIAHCVDGDFDYVSNALTPTFPDGLDTEVIKFDALVKAWQKAKLISEREHVTPFIYNHPEQFKIGQFKNPIDLSHLRWTVDEAKDFELITHIYENLLPSKPDFNMSDVLKFLEAHPELKSYNTSIKRNEGYEKSIQNDAVFNPRKG